MAHAKPYQTLGGLGCTAWRGQPATLLNTRTSLDHGWLFSGPPHQDKITSKWQTLCKRTKINGFTPHSLRHFYASGLIASGADVATVQRALGHSSPSITLDTYTHLWPTAEDRTRSAASALMAQVTGSNVRVLRTAD